LWQYRPGAADSGPPPGTIPTLDDYSALIEDKTSDAQRAHRANLAEKLKGKRK
jgi:hypothetical protein